MSKESALAFATSQPQGSPEVIPTANQGGAIVSHPQNPLPDSPTPAEAELPSKAFGVIAKKEAELQRLREEFKKEREVFASERSQVESIQKQYQEYMALKSKDPVAAMKMLGFSETDLINYLAANQPQELTPEQKAAQAAKEAADARIKEFEEMQAKRQAEEQAKADQKLIDQYRQGIAGAIKAAPEKYEYCNYFGDAAQELIYETVLAVVKESGGKDVPTPDEAAAMVEAYYEEQDKEMSKIKKRTPVIQEAPAPVETKTTPPARPTRTLNSQATATVAAAKPIAGETREQKRERLIQRLRNGT